MHLCQRCVDTADSQQLPGLSFVFRLCCCCCCCCCCSNFESHEKTNKPNGSPECSAPLGVESNSILGHKIDVIASSELNSSYRADLGRLNMKPVPGGHEGVWCSAVNSNQWLQVDLYHVHVITGVATQGLNSSAQQMWVTKYKVSHSKNAVNWTVYKENNRTRVMAQKNNLTLLDFSRPIHSYFLPSFCFLPSLLLFVSFLLLSFFLSFFLLSFLPSFFLLFFFLCPSFLPSSFLLPSFLLLSFFFPSFLPSSSFLLPSLLPSSFLPSFLPSVWFSRSLFLFPFFLYISL